MGNRPNLKKENITSTQEDSFKSPPSHCPLHIYSHTRITTADFHHHRLLLLVFEFYLKCIIHYVLLHLFFTEL